LANATQDATPLIGINERTAIDDDHIASHLRRGIGWLNQLEPIVNGLPLNLQQGCEFLLTTLVRYESNPSDDVSPAHQEASSDTGTETLRPIRPMNQTCIWATYRTSGDEVS